MFNRLKPSTCGLIAKHKAGEQSLVECWGEQATRKGSYGRWFASQYLWLRHNGGRWKGEAVRRSQSSV